MSNLTSITTSWTIPISTKVFRKTRKRIHRTSVAFKGWRLDVTHGCDRTSLTLVLQAVLYEEEYGFELKVDQHIENYFRGYISRPKYGRRGYLECDQPQRVRAPYYLGESDPWLTAPLTRSSDPDLTIPSALKVNSPGPRGDPSDRRLCFTT